MITEGRTIWVLRHGLREDSHPVHWCESVAHMVDPDLHPIGVEMSKAVALRFAGEQVDHILASPFLRTIHTAALIGRIIGKPVKVEYGFHEMMEPKWFPDGMPRLPPPAERATAFPEIDLSYKSLVCPSYAELNDAHEPFGLRVRASLDAALASLDGNIMIVTHYAVCNCLKNIFTGSYMDGYIELTSISKYVWNKSAWEPRLISDASHVHQFYPKR